MTAETEVARPTTVQPRTGDPEISAEVVDDHGLSPEEYERIKGIMGRTPTFTELGIFSAMWSEHCGYKNSRPLLRLLPTKAPWVIQGPGENAGVIDIGDGWALAFKIESHNHPSAVAAPGVTDLDTVVRSSRGAAIAADHGDDAWPILQPDRPVCALEDDAWTLEVTSRRGAGRFAAEVWRLPAPPP